MANYTAIATGAAADAATFNAPLAQLDTAIGLLTALNTAAQASLVAAINEVHDDLGTLTSLLTTDKDSAVDAINEVYSTFASGGSIGGNVSVSGNVTATAFVGNGAGLTGIASGTGGVTNTGSTTIGADTGATGVGIIALQTRGSTKMDIENLGDVNIYYDLAIGATSGADSNNLILTGRAAFTASVSPATGAEAAFTVTANAYSDAGGSQWASIFAKVNTVAAQTAVDELDGLLTALYHSQGFTVPEWKGIETGAGFIDGVGTVVTQHTGLDANIPTVTGGAAVTTAAAIRIPSKATTGMTNVYAIMGDLVATSYLSGTLEIHNVATAIEVYRDGGSTVIKASVHQAAANTGARFRSQFSRGTRAAPSQVSSGDLVGRYESYPYIDGDYRLSGALEFYAAGTPSATSYAGDLYVRLVTDGATAISTKAIFSEAGDLTLGATKITGATGRMFANLMGIKDGITAPSAIVGIAQIYVDTADGDLKIIFGDGTVKLLSADT
jgi:hypothetical protein